MDKPHYVHKRKKRYMAQSLTEFERLVEPLIPPAVADEMKGIIRRKFHALAVDTVEIINLKPGEELNGVLVEVRDRMHVEGRPISARGDTA
jgi:hypothetical protein